MPSSDKAWMRACIRTITLSVKRTIADTMPNHYRFIIRAGCHPGAFLVIAKTSYTEIVPVQTLAVLLSLEIDQVCEGIFASHCYLITST